MNGFAIIEFYTHLWKISDPHFGSGKILEDGDRLANLFTQCPDDLHLAFMLLMCSMRKIEPCNIHSSKDHLTEHIDAFAARAEGSDDLGFSIHYMNSYMKFNCRACFQGLPGNSDERLKSKPSPVDGLICHTGRPCHIL